MTFVQDRKEEHKIVKKENQRWVVGSSVVNVVHLRKVFLSHVSGVKEFSCENFEYAPESTYSIVCKVHLDFFKKYILPDTDVSWRSKRVVFQHLSFFSLD